MCGRFCACEPLEPLETLVPVHVWPVPVHVHVWPFLSAVSAGWRSAPTLPSPKPAAGQAIPLTPAGGGHARRILQSRASSHRFDVELDQLV